MTNSADAGHQTTVSLTEVIEQRSHHQRRRVLIERTRANPRNSEECTSSDEVDGIELSDTHLPKLADNGCIDWEWESATISCGSRFDEIDTLLSLSTYHQDKLPEGWS